MKCKECGFSNTCVNQNNHLCKECDEQFKYCYTECKNPCRTKDEQEKIFSQVKPDWKECLK